MAIDITKRRRFLALLLVFALLCSFLLIRVNAEEAPEDDTAEESTEEATEETTAEESSCCGEGCTMSCCMEEEEIPTECGCSAAEEAAYTVTITVEDPDGTALSGATVTVNGTALTTDDNGQAQFELISGTYTVTVSVEDVSAESTLTVAAGTAELTIVLEYSCQEDTCTGGEDCTMACCTEEQASCCSSSDAEDEILISSESEIAIASAVSSEDDGIAAVTTYSTCGSWCGNTCKTAYECWEDGVAEIDCACVDDDDDDEETYTVTFNLTSLTKTSGSTTVTEKHSYTAYLSADTGYSLPTSITVKVGSTVLTTSSYTYSSSTGRIYISSTSVTGNITITASGKANSYTITWDYNDGSGNSTTTSQQYGSKLSLPTSPTRSGYTFDGWYTTASGGTQVTSSTTYKTAGTTTYYAHWTQTAYTYSITYLDAGGEAFSGTLPDDAPTEHTYGTDTELPTPARDGYTFNGWYLDADCTELVTVLGAEDYSEDITLYASWSLIMSVTVPSTLVLVMSEDGTVYAATSAEITNNSYAAVEITSLTVVASGDWTIVSCDYDMAGAKVDSNLIGISVNGCGTTQTGTSETLELDGGWEIDARSSLTLTCSAVISALSEAVTGESVLSLIYMVNWA